MPVSGAPHAKAALLPIASKHLSLDNVEKMRALSGGTRNPACARGLPGLTARVLCKLACRAHAGLPLPQPSFLSVTGRPVCRRPPLNEVLTKSFVRLDYSIAQAFIKGVNTGTHHVRAQANRTRTTCLRPAFRLLNDSPEPTPAIIFINNKSGDFGWHVCQQRVIQKDVHPANQSSIGLGDVHGMYGMPYNLSQPSGSFLVAKWIPQLVGEAGDTLGVVNGCGTDGRCTRHGSEPTTTTASFWRMEQHMRREDCGKASSAT